MEGIQINVTQTGADQDIVLVKITGYIDTTTSSELERILQTLLREQKFKIIIDLKSVDYISSAGWGIFISEIKNIRLQHGDLKLANMSESVNEVYELLEFSTILTSSPTIEEAVSLFDGSAGPVAAKGNNKSKAAASAAKAAPAPLRGGVGKPATPSPAPTSAVPPAAEASMPVPEPPAAEAAPARTAMLIPLIDRIKSVVRAHPDWGAWRIKNELNRLRGRQPKVSWGEVRSELKYSKLASKNARYRFARGA